MVEMIEAVIFDWDGVVLDSSRFHEKSWDVLAKERSLDLPEGHFKKGFGKRNEEIIPHVLGWAEEGSEMLRELAARKEEIYRELLFENASEVKALPGIPELIQECQDAGVRMGIGSSTPLKNLQAGLKVLGLGHILFEMVSGDDVKQGKPDPEVFEKVAQKLNAPQEFCVVLEDSHSGIEAAKRAGMKSVGIATTHPLESLCADLNLPSSKELKLEDLKKLWN